MYILTCTCIYIYQYNIIYIYIYILSLTKNLTCYNRVIKYWWKSLQILVFKFYVLFPQLGPVYPGAHLQL